MKLKILFLLYLTFFIISCDYDKSPTVKANIIIKAHDKNTNKRVLNPMVKKFRSCKYLGNLKVQ